MHEAFSTPNLVALPITSQELGRGAFCPPPNQNRTIKKPNHYGVKVPIVFRRGWVDGIGYVMYC